MFGQGRILALAAAAALAGVALLAACRDGGSSPGGTPAPAATITPRPSATPTITPTATATPITVTGLFTDPRPIVAHERRSLGPAPALFPPWNGTSTMLYDIAAGTATDLGPGMAGVFSPDGKWMAWRANIEPDGGGGDVRVMDLATLSARIVGHGFEPGFTAEGLLGYYEGTSSFVLDLDTGERRKVDKAITNAYREFQGNSRRTSDGFFINRVLTTERRYELIDLKQDRVVLTFRATRAVPAGPGTLAVAALPDAKQVAVAEGGPMIDVGTINIFLVAYDGTATFIATSRLDTGLPLAANADFVAWGDNYCAPANATTKIFDRRTRRITEVDGKHWVEDFTPQGLLAIGEFGARALIDPVTLDQRAALPDVIEPRWSDDYKFASTGRFVGGHGGNCWR